MIETKIKDKVSKYIDEPSDEEVKNALPDAIKKFERIITLMGDGDGKRMNVDYFAQLVSEIILITRAEAYFERDFENKKRRVAEANAPKSQTNDTTPSQKSQAVNISIYIGEIKYGR